MVAPTPDAGLFSRLVRRLSIWLQPRTPRRFSHFSRFRPCNAWFRPRREVSAQALETRAKRQDLVRRRELEHLRSLRASAVWPSSGMEKAPAAVGQALPTPSPAPSPAPAPALSAMARAQMLQQIDAIEALMRRPTSDSGVSRSAGSGRAIGHPNAVASGGGEGADPDDGATRLASAADLWPAKPPKPGAA